MPCSDEDKLVYNIKELPEVFNVEPVDLFVVETLAGTSIVAFENINIDITQTTFEEPFEKHTTDIEELSTKVALVEALVLDGDDDNNTDSLAALRLQIVDSIYPVGSIYITLNSASPVSILGTGQWELRSGGRVLAGIGDGTDINGIERTVETGADDDTIGEYEHILSEDEMPNHSHAVNTGGMAGGTVGPSQGGNHSENSGGAGSRRGGTAIATGGNQPHNNMPPYFGVYVWERTA